MSQEKKPRGRPIGSGKGGKRVVFSRRIDAELLREFQEYVDGLQPRTSDTAVLEMWLRRCLDEAKGRKKP